MSPQGVDGLFLPQGATVFPRRGVPGIGPPGAAVPYLHGPFSCSRPALLLQPELLLQPLPSWPHLGLSLPVSPSSILGHVFSLPGYTDFISPIFFSGPKQKQRWPTAKELVSPVCGCHLTARTSPSTLLSRAGKTGNKVTIQRSC